MNNTQHTPGPWKLSLGSEYVIDGGNGQNVFLIGNDRRAIPSADDARLILAAPDLLDALQAALARVEIANNEGDPILLAWVSDARAAIAKATGGAK